MKTYRFTMYAHQEIDIKANNKEDATKQAEKEWDECFGQKGLFGGIEYEEQVCRECGCTWDNACPGGCFWVGEGLCNRCDRKG